MRNYQGASLIELLLALLLLSLAAGQLLPVASRFIARQQLSFCSRQLQADIHTLQILARNNDTTTVTLLFSHLPPYEYYLVANNSVLRTVALPRGIVLSGRENSVIFSSSGAPVSGAQCVSLYSFAAGSWQYVILAPVTGRVRISERPPAAGED